jgi:hypothetical protein
MARGKVMPPALNDISSAYAQQGLERRAHSWPACPRASRLHRDKPSGTDDGLGRAASGRGRPRTTRSLPPARASHNVEAEAEAVRAPPASRPWTPPTHFLGTPSGTTPAVTPSMGNPAGTTTQREPPSGTPSGSPTETPPTDPPTEHHDARTAPRTNVPPRPRSTAPTGGGLGAGALCTADRALQHFAGGPDHDRDRPVRRR